MKKAPRSYLLVLAVVVAWAPALQAQALEEGRWVGRMMHPTGDFMDLFLEVSTKGDALQIVMDVPSVRRFPLHDARYDEGVIRFWWEAGVLLECSIERQDDGIFLGACRDRQGGQGPLMVIPPSVAREAVEIDTETLLANRELPPEAPVQTLAELYAEGASSTGDAVEVGGSRFNVLTMGEGDVTVVLEAGLGDDLGVWNMVQPVVAEGTRVMAYDRAGLGNSEPSPMPRTPEQLATELHALLRQAGLAPPYVLVGHAEGGFAVRRFASLYPDEVAGMVLVDASHEEQGARWKALDEAAWEQYVDQRSAVYLIVKGPLQAEYEAFDQVMKEQEVPGLGPLPDVPVVILTAMQSVEEPRYIGETEKGLRVKFDLHKAWADQAERATHRATTKSGSYIHLEEPKLVIDAIREIVEAVRGSE